MSRKSDKAQGPEQSGPDASVEDQEAFRVWMSFLFPAFDLAGWDRWLANLDPCGAKEELERERRALYTAHLGHDHDRMADKLKIMLFRRAMVSGKPMALKGQAGMRQRKVATVNAANERKAEAYPRKLLARDLAKKVPHRIRLQGQMAVAREVKKLASRMDPQTDTSDKVAALCERRLVTLIYGK